MGLRAFTSQLLCEQVVGRGLRRTSLRRESEDTACSSPSTSTSSACRSRSCRTRKGGDAPPPPPKPKTRVEPIREREQEFGITWPNVIRIEHVYRPRLTLDLDKRASAARSMPPDTPTYAELAAILEGKPNVTRCREIDLEELGRKHRLQTIVFETARDVFDQMQPTWKGTQGVAAGAGHSAGRAIPALGPDSRSCRRSSTQDELKPPAAADAEHEPDRPARLGGDPLREHRRGWSRSSTRSGRSSARPTCGRGTRRGRASRRRKLAHQRCVYDSTWEASESFALDRGAAWSMPGSRTTTSASRSCTSSAASCGSTGPTFSIRLTNGVMLVLEVKGEEADEIRAKHEFLGRMGRGRELATAASDGGRGMSRTTRLRLKAS